MLYQTVRPKKLSEFAGNEGTVLALEKYLSSKPKDRNHSILLFGPSGCGKTTLARIIAFNIGCQQADITEINAANTRGIDTIREINDTAHLLPWGKAKAYILDESHQLTPSAQEALLKIIEDYPEHCYFVFCTTDKNRLIKTILNRCVHFEVSRLGERALVKLLSSVCKKINVEIPKQVIRAIAKACDGSPRQALVLLEKIKDIDDESKVMELLDKNTERDDTIWDLCRLLLADPAIRKKRWREVLNAFLSLDGEDSESIRKAIISVLFKRLGESDDVGIAFDISLLIKLLSVPTYAGGKPQLASLLMEACLGK